MTQPYDAETAERIVLPETWHLEFEHAAGETASRFLVALRDRQVLLGSPCPACGRVFVPARAFCEDCFVPTSDNWRELSSEGVLESFTITYAELAGYRKPPYAIAYVRPDGADTAMGNWVSGVPLDDLDAAVARLAVGTRMRAVFEPTPRAHVTTFTWTPATATVPSSSG